MAITSTLFTTGAASGADQTAYDAVAATPSAAALLVAGARATATVNAANTITDPGGPLWTWIERYGDRVTNTVLVSTASAQAASTIVRFDCALDAATGCGMNIVHMVGASLQNPLAQAVVSNSGTGAAPSVTFGSALNTLNSYILFLWSLTNPPGVTAPTGWTRIVETGYTVPTSGVAVYVRDGGETATTITCGSSANNWRILGVEINDAAVGFLHRETTNVNQAPSRAAFW